MSQKFEHFGKYILLEKLAMGGMAEVFLSKAAGAGGIGKFFAIKRILPQYSDNKDFNRMFKDEAKVVMNLKHANIVSIFEFGVERGQFFLVMELVDGKNLRQILNKMKKSKVKFTAEQIVYTIKEIAAGLDHAHRCQDTETGKPLNITHRDVSPQNIMISYDGEMKVVDFGIAKAESQLENTRAGTLKGKFGYMSPEQAEGHPVDLRTDVFSLGIILWELLANERLFIANNEINTLKKIRDCEVPSLKEYMPNIHPDLEQIVYKALLKDRNIRYQTAAALQRDLNRFLNRQYPDYAPQDFAKSIKTLFSDEILESRNKLVDFAKQSAQFQAPKVNETNEIAGSDSNQGNKILDMLRTKPDANSISSSDSSSDSTPLDLSRYNSPNKKEDKTQVTDSNASALDASALQKELSRSIQLTQAKTKTSHQQNYQEQPTAPRQRSRPNINVDDSRSNTNTESQLNYENSQHRPPNRVSPSQLVFIVILCTIGTLIIFPLMKKVAPGPMNAFLIPLYESTKLSVFEPVDREVESSSEVSPDDSRKPPPMEDISEPKEAKARFYIQSNPSGAEIHLDSRNTGYVTPATILVPSDRSFDISLKRSGYVSYQKDQIDLSQGDENTLSTTLYAMDTGKLDIDVRPVHNSRIYINGKWLEGETLPIRGYIVPANTRIVVKAVNPYTNATTQEVVKLNKNERKSIMLRLKKRRPSSRNY